MNKRNYRRKWLSLRAGYEKRMYRIIKTGISQTVASIPFSLLTDLNYEELIRASINENNIRNVIAEGYLYIGTRYGHKVGTGINKEIKAFNFDLFSTDFRSFLIDWLAENGGQKITSITQTLAKSLIENIKNGISEGRTVREIARDLQSIVGKQNFYRWQALRIARTETTAAANLGAIKATENSGVLSEKIWISSRNARTRRRPPSDYDHWEMEGVRVGVNEPFIVNGDEVQYPGDPKGSAGNVIQCRCTVAIVPKRDANGNLIFL